MRIGIGEPMGSQTSFVLGRFSSEERAVIDPACKLAADAVGVVDVIHRADNGPVPTVHEIREQVFAPLDADAIALGAHGVQMGTRFVATTECEAHAAYKEALVDAGSEDALVYCRSHHASRGLATPIVRDLIELEHIGAGREDLQALRGRHRAKLGCIEGDLEEGICPAGSGVGMVCDVLPVEELVTRIVDEVHGLMEELERAFDERCPS